MGINMREVKRHWDRRESKFHGEENKWVCSFFPAKGKSDREQKKLKKNKKKVFPVKLLFSVDASSRKKNKYKENFLWCGMKKKKKGKKVLYWQRRRTQQHSTHEKKNLWMNFEQENPLVTQIAIFGLRFYLPDSACHKLPYLVVSTLCEINP